MCFSPVGDLAGGVVVTAIGIDACRHLKGRPENLAIAGFPLLLGLHQVDEAFVWWGLQGHVSTQVGRVAMWIYLVFALVVLPVLVPTLLAVFEHSRRRRWRYVALRGPRRVRVGGPARVDARGSPDRAPRRVPPRLLHRATPRGRLIGLYIVATCGPLLASGRRVLVWFGVANLVAVLALALLCASGFTSLWCFYAALVSGAIALHLRQRDHRAVPSTLATVG